MAQRLRPIATAFLASVLAAFAACQLAAADERVLHRSVLPDGRVVYGDEPAPGATEVTDLRVEPHPADPQQPSRAQKGCSSNGPPHCAPSSCAEPASVNLTA